MRQPSKVDGIGSGLLTPETSMAGPGRDVLRAGGKGSKQVWSGGDIEGPSLEPPKTGVANPSGMQLRIEGNRPKRRGSSTGIGGSDRPKPMSDMVRPGMAMERVGRELSGRKESRTGGLNPKRVWPKMLKLDATRKRLLTGSARPGRVRSGAGEGAPEQAMP